MATVDSVLPPVAEPARAEVVAPRWLHSIGACCEATLDARDVVTRCYAMFCGRARARDVTLLTEVSGPLPAFAGCEASLTRALHRGVAEAIDHAPAGSLVLVAASPCPDGIAIEVCEQQLMRAGLWRTRRLPSVPRFRLVLPLATDALDVAAMH